MYDKGFVTIQAENYAVKYWPSKLKSELPGFHSRGYFMSQLNSSSWSGNLWHEDDAGAQHEGHLHGPSGWPRTVLARPGPQGHGHRRKEYSGEKRFLVLTPSWRALKEFIEVIKENNSSDDNGVQFQQTNYSIKSLDLGLGKTCELRFSLTSKLT